MTMQTGALVGKYEVIGPLGRGAFSTTFQARDRDTGALVVLKFPDPALLGDPAVFERFKRELAIGQQLVHPHIARAVEIGESDTGLYLVVEFVEGIPFRTYLAEHAPLPIDAAVRYGMELADALAYAHEHGVFHRDLKPENLIISSDDSLHVVDFGTAFLEGARRMTWRFMSERLGTPDYMSPEQIQGKRGDARSDIYSMGVILYEMLTGRVPFSGDNSLAVMSQHVGVAPPSPRAVNGAVPPALAGIVLKALRKDPDERYQHAGELRDDLDHYADLDPATFALPAEELTAYSEGRSMLVGALIGGLVILGGVLIVAVGYILHQH